MNEQVLEFDDLGTAIREGRPLHRARAYRIEIAVDDVVFDGVLLPDAKPLGRVIVSASGLDPHSDPSLFAILPNGDFAEVILDEPFDIRAHSVDRFIAFTTDRDFKLTLNGARVHWGLPQVSGYDLCVVARAPDDDAVYLVQSNGEKRRVATDEQIDLSQPGVEHFVIARREEKFEIVVNGREFTVHNRRQTFDDLVAIAFPGQMPAANTVYSITYRQAASEPHAGELGMGGYILVKNGTIINVSRTVQS